MICKFRSSVPLLALPLLLTLCTTPVHAANADEPLPDAQTINQLEIRAQQANPRDQCFLYVQLVHTLTELAGKQMLDGDTAGASATLNKVAHYVALIHLRMSRDSKRLKNAEMLMHRTTYRLTEYLHLTSGDDHTTLQSTLNQLGQLQDDLLNQVFNQ